MKISLGSSIADLNRQKKAEENMKNQLKVCSPKNKKKKDRKFKRPVGHHHACQHTHNGSSRRRRQRKSKKNA